MDANGMYRIVEGRPAFHPSGKSGSSLLVEEMIEVHVAWGWLRGVIRHLRLKWLGEVSLWVRKRPSGTPASKIHQPGELYGFLMLLGSRDPRIHSKLKSCY